MFAPLLYLDFRRDRYFVTLASKRSQSVFSPTKLRFGHVTFMGWKRAASEKMRLGERTICELPCILWLKIKKPPKFSVSWFANWGCIGVGVLLMLASTIGGLRSIVQDASMFQFYS
ncbi:unnamed protein product [Urochloa humidicola]